MSMSEINEMPDGVVLTNLTQTKDPILPTDRWPDLTFNELLDQRSLIYDKWEWLVEKQNPLEKEFAQFYVNIDNYIKSKI
jgi:hypothetical protein